MKGAQNVWAIGTVRDQLLCLYIRDLELRDQVLRDLEVRDQVLRDLEVRDQLVRTLAT